MGSSALLSHEDCFVIMQSPSRSTFTHYSLLFNKIKKLQSIQWYNFQQNRDLMDDRMNHWTARSPPSACIIFSLLPLMFKRYSNSKIITPRTAPLTLQSPLFPATISERVQEAVLYPGSLTLMVLPLIEWARTQCPPLCTFRMTTSPALREAWMLALATFPTQESPRELTDPQTKRSPLTQPPCPLSQVFKVPGLQLFPIPERAMATELMRHPALQIVLDEVPS